MALLSIKVTATLAAPAPPSPQPGVPVVSKLAPLTLAPIHLTV